MSSSTKPLVNKGNINIRHFSPPSPSITSAINDSFRPGTTIPARPSVDSSTQAERDFHDAIAVRVAVFVHEQASPYEEEIDPDDARSWHWIAYDDDGSSSSSSSGPRPDPAITAVSVQHPPADDAAAAAAANNNNNDKPVATIRLVPGPHLQHPLPGCELFEVSASNPTGGGSADKYPSSVRPRIAGKQRDVGTAMHDGRELYIKLGRLATVKEARGKGLAKRLIEGALEWAATTEGKEKLNRDGGGAVEGDDGDDVGREWKGLVLVHSQTEVAPLYRRCGFLEDPELGTWTEGGIPHVAMWRRLQLASD